LRASAFFAPTLRQPPQGVALPGQAFLLRGAFAGRLPNGAYVLLPLGARVLQGIRRLATQALQGIGGQQIILPSPSEAQFDAGEESARQAARFRAVLQTLAAGVRSYKDLPLLLYDFATAPPSAPKPSLGLLGGALSDLLSLYSFCSDGDQLACARRRVLAALEEALAACGVPCLNAQTWSEASEETALVWEHPAGTMQLLHCQGCGWTADVRGASCRTPVGTRPTPKEEATEVVTPGATTVASVTAMLSVSSDRLVKTLLYKAGDAFVAALVRGDHELDERKLVRALGQRELRMANSAEIERLTGGPVGFSGPVGLPRSILVLADHAVALRSDFIVGANQADKHLTGVNLDRDFKVQAFADLHQAMPGDPCPSCGVALAAKQAFALGGVEGLDAAAGPGGSGHSVQAKDGSRTDLRALHAWLDLTLVMGAAAEAHATDVGVVWPASIAPFEAHLLLLDPSNPEIRAAADLLSDGLGQGGLTVLYDDRDERAGVKFHDADLCGIPYLLLVGRRLQEEGVVEVRARAAAQERQVPPAEVLALLRGELR